MLGNYRFMDHYGAIVTCCDTGPWFFQYHSKDCSNVLHVLSSFNYKQGVLRTYSNPDPHRTMCLCQSHVYYIPVPNVYLLSIFGLATNIQQHVHCFLFL